MRQSQVPLGHLSGFWIAAGSLGPATADKEPYLIVQIWHPVRCVTVSIKYCMVQSLLPPITLTSPLKHPSLL